MKTKILYVAQYDDDPYCAPYAKYIFDNKENTFEFAKLKYKNKEPREYTEFRCIEEYEYNNDAKRYESNEKEWFYIKEPSEVHNYTDEFIDGDTYWDEVDFHMKRGKYYEGN